MVVCRMLGYDPAAAVAVTNSWHGAAGGDFVMDEVQRGRELNKLKLSYRQRNLIRCYVEVDCSGSEASLEQCPHSAQHDCSSHEAAGIICSGGQQQVCGVIYGRSIKWF